MKHINVFAMPRSGTNLFAVANHIHPKIYSINVGGGRHPNSLTWRHLEKKSILKQGGIFKKREGVRYILHDELKHSLIGRKATYLAQLFYAIHMQLQRNCIRIILIRNPYCIAASMHKYNKKHSTHPHWDMSIEDNMNKFANEFCDMILEPTRGNRRYVSFLIDDFFSSDSVRSAYFDLLALPPIEYKGLSGMLCRCGHPLRPDSGNILHCTKCGPIEGYGEIDLSSKVDVLRLRDVSPLPSQAATWITKILGYRLGDAGSAFAVNGNTDLGKLEQVLSQGTSILLTRN